MSRSVPLDVQPKTCSSCLGMFAILPPSNQVIWRPDFRAEGKVTSRSENGFGQRAGSITINTAVCVGLHADSWTSVCLYVKSSRQPHTQCVSNRPIRGKTCRTEGTAQKTEMEMMPSHVTLPTFNVPTYFEAHLFLLSFSFFSQMYPDVTGDVQSITGERESEIVCTRVMFCLAQFVFFSKSAHNRPACARRIPSRYSVWMGSTSACM